MVHVLGSLLYLLKGSATVQDWARPVSLQREKETGEETEDGFTEIEL